MTCAEARLRLQDGRGPADALPALQDHLQTCLQCHRFARRQATLDAAIVQSLGAGVAGLSVRGSVQSRIEREAASRARRGSAGYSVLRLAVPLALIAAALAVALPQYATHLRDNVSSAQVFTPVQPQIAYPLTTDAARPSHLLAGAL